jgi:hypothetical protein
MKKTIVFLLLTGLLAGCVRQIYLDIPLTENEKAFFVQMQENSLYPIDSINRVITDDLVGNWFIYKIKHIHIDLYLDMQRNIEKNFQETIKADANKIATFVSGLSIKNVNFKKCSITFSYRDGGDSFRYYVTDGKIVEIQDD